MFGDNIGIGVGINDFTRLSHRNGCGQHDVVGLAIRYLIFTTHSLPGRLLAPLQRPTEATDHRACGMWGLIPDRLIVLIDVTTAGG